MGSAGSRKASAPPASGPASLASLRRAMRAQATPARAEVSQRFFKTGPGQYGEGDRFLGLAVPVLRQLAREYQTLAIRDVRALLLSPWHEERLVALFILNRYYKRGSAEEREAIYRLYLRMTHRINNWDLVDSSAEFIVGAHLDGRDQGVLVKLARSKHLWERRIAMLATFHGIKRGQFSTAVRIATILINDPHDLIHKAVGWMLREIGQRDRAVEEAFLRKHVGRMPRTMLRYAIEQFPPRLRRRYLAA